MIYMAITTKFCYIEAPTSSEFTATPLGASSPWSWAETSSMAEFNWAIFSVNILRVLCSHHTTNAISMHCKHFKKMITKTISIIVKRGWKYKLTQTICTMFLFLFLFLEAQFIKLTYTYEPLYFSCFSYDNQP